MFRFNFILISILTFALHGFAQEETTYSPSTSSNLNLRYISWHESAKLEAGSKKDNTKHADFYGLSLGYEKASFNSRWGCIWDAAFISGQANIGEAAGEIPYQKSYVQWFGVSGSYRLGFKVTEPITLSAGPMLLARQLTWPDKPAGTDIKTGADVNAGFVGDIRIHFAENWELQQSIAGLLSEASTFWSLGVGYRF